jgi:hypothetical protein
MWILMRITLFVVVRTRFDLQKPNSPRAKIAYMKSKLFSYLNPVIRNNFSSSDDCQFSGLDQGLLKRQ